MWTRRAGRTLLAPAWLAGFVLVAAPGRAEAPLSAIDWLSRSVAEPVSTVVPAPPPRPDGSSAGSGSISVTPLADSQGIDGMGLLPTSRTGLPRGLWGATPTADLTRMLRAERVDTLPEIQSLLYTLLLAELAPPKDSTGDGTLFLARVDRLLDMGALDQALALLDEVQKPTAETFRRSFDASLLLGQEDRACATLAKSPEISPSFPARIFCLARGGDWNAAALSLRTGEALGFITPGEGPLLERFLDPDLAESEPDLPMPDRPSPLVLRMMEAIGQPMTTTTLPVAFAHADLGPTAGWKTRIEAGERLARSGAIDPNRLLGLYTEQKPAASGGVWDRVAAIQRLDAAVAAGDARAVSIALPEAWAQMETVELEVPLAVLYSPALQGLKLEGEAGAIAFRLGLLSPDYEKVATARVAEGGVEPFLKGLALGDVSGVAPPDQMGSAIKAAFLPDTPLDPQFAALIAGDRLGEAMLRAIDHVTDGARGDLRDLTAGLRLFREVGLESVARRAALQLLLLERRG